MIFLDSWVWLEYLVSGATDEAAEVAIERANTADEGGLIAPTVRTDVSDCVRVVEDEATATETVRAMREYEYIDSALLIDEVAEEAAALRDTYSEPGERERSYADAIHLATAIRYDECDALYAGDPDFDGIDEIETVVL